MSTVRNQTPNNESSASDTLQSMRAKTETTNMGLQSAAADMHSTNRRYRTQTAFGE